MPCAPRQWAAREAAPARVSDEKKVGGVDPRGVEIGDLDGSLSEAQHGRPSVLRDLDVVEALDARIGRDLDAIGAVLEAPDQVVAERDQVEDEDVLGAGLAEESVVVRAAGHPRAAATGVEPVVALAALELVEALAAVEPVVALVALDVVPARAAADPVAALAALDLVVALAAEQPVVALLAEDLVVAGAAIGAVVAVAGLDLVVAAAAPDHVVAVERDELIVLVGADEPIPAVGADQAADAGCLDQRLDLLAAQRRVADGNEGVVEIAVEILGAGEAVLEAHDVDPVDSVGEVARKRVLAGHRVEEVEAVAVADGVESADRQQVALGVGDHRRDAVEDGGRAGRVGCRVVAVVEVGDVARREVAEEEAAVLVVLELDADILDIGDQEEAERLAGRRLSSSPSRPPSVLGVDEEDARLADLARHRIEGIGADRAVGAGVLPEEGDGLGRAVSGEGEIRRIDGGGDVDLAPVLDLDEEARARPPNTNSSSRTWPTPGAKYLKAPTPGSRPEVSRILTTFVKGAEVGLDVEPGGDHLAFVLGHPGVELLEIAVARHRIRAHDPARQGAVDACLPRPVEVGPDELAFVVVVVVRRDLAQVPDVAVIVLRVPVERVLDQDAVRIGRVADDDDLDAVDRLRLERGEVIVALRLLLAGLGIDLCGAVAVDRPAGQREERGCRWSWNCRTWRRRNWAKWPW